MPNFNSLIEKLDKGNIAGSIVDLPLQLESAWNGIKELKLSQNYKSVNEIIVCGMGGSALGTDLLCSVFYDKLKRPLIIINDYKLPFYTSTKSLVIISSYSGNTAESLSCLLEAQKRKCKIIIITAGGKLSKIAKAKKIPAYILDACFNPSGQPRMGLGYSIMVQLGILNKLGLAQISENQVKKAILVFNKDIEKKAKSLSVKIKGKIPLIIAAEHLGGSAHILSNQINENAKNFADYFLLPEINHHLMEGLFYPKSTRNLIFLFLESKIYSSPIKKRIAITKRVLRKNRIIYLSYEAQSQKKLFEALEVLSFGSWLSFYLSLLNNINPSLIPMVDYFKKELEKK